MPTKAGCRRLPKPSQEAFADPKLVLFQSFVCNTESERGKRSNTIELWDAVPKYCCSRKQMASLRVNGRFLPSMQRAFRHKDRGYLLRLYPAPILDFDAVERYYSPSAREEFVEDALRKLATKPGLSFHGETGGLPRSGVCFSLYLLRKELAARGHAITYADVKREYAVLNGINHPGILRAKGYTEHERGPALVYEYLPSSQRLDHYLSERGDRLTVDNRLDLLRQIAEAVRYAHGKRLFHRALSPQNILVLDPEAESPQLQVFNWQTAAREPLGSRTTSLGFSRTSHLANFIEEASAVYMAPEALAERSDAGEQADVFSLGALAYHLFSGAPPARTFCDLGEKLREGKGLQISSVLDGAAESLQYLIQFSTYRRSRVGSTRLSISWTSWKSSRTRSPPPSRGRAWSMTPPWPNPAISWSMV